MHGAIGTLLRFTTGALVIGGLVGLVAAGWFALRGRPYRPGKHPKRFALVSLGSLAVGVVAIAFIRGVVEPHPALRPRPVPSAELLVVTEQRFDGVEPPAVAVEAPNGWRLEYDRARGVVTIVKGSGPATEAAVSLTIDAALLLDDASPERLLATARPLLEQQGLHASPAFADKIAGAEAQGLVAEGSNGSFCTWVVKRGRRYVSSLRCVARTGDSRHACDEVLARLTWRRPSGIPDSDLE